MFNSEDYFWSEYEPNVGTIDNPMSSSQWTNNYPEMKQESEDPWLAAFPSTETDYWGNDLDMLGNDENSNSSIPKQTFEFQSLSSVENAPPSAAEATEIADKNSDDVEIVAESYVYASKSGQKSQIVVTRKPERNGFTSSFDIRVYGRNSPRPTNNNFILPGKMVAPTKPPAPGQKRCSCFKSHCLKMYCECFSSGKFCVDCSCKDCCNTLGSTFRRTAVKESLQRNPIAFRPKIGVAGKGRSKILRFHQKGCRCKKTNCLKNYCECYEAKVGCTDRCGCVGCQNKVDVSDDDDESSSDDGETNNQFAELEMPWNLLNDAVIEAATDCLLISYNDATSQGRSSDEALTNVFNEFGTCMKQVFEASKFGSQNGSM